MVLASTLWQFADFYVETVLVYSVGPTETLHRQDAYVPWFE
jgi:hypothetical protein